MSSRFEALLREFARRPSLGGEDDDPWSRWGLCVQNCTARSDEARRVLLRRSTNVLGALLPHLDARLAPHPARRRGVAAALKHCALEKDEHFYLNDELDAPKFVVSALADSSDAARLRETEPDRAAQLFAAWGEDMLVSSPREPDTSVAVLLLETLLLLCATRRVRARLKASALYVVVRDADLFYNGVTGRDDTGGPPEDDDDEEQQPQGVLVTADDGGGDDDESDGTKADTQTQKGARALSRVCADLADMLLRDEDDAPLATDEDHAPFRAPTKGTTHQAADVVSETTTTKTTPRRAPASSSFGGLKGGFLKSTAKAKAGSKSRKQNETSSSTEPFKSVVVTDEELAEKVGAFDLPD